MHKRVIPSLLAKRLARQAEAETRTPPELRETLRLVDQLRRKVGKRRK